jgi:sarcosine oxidase subunit gamma
VSDLQLTARTGFGLDKTLAEHWQGFAMEEIVGLNIHHLSVAAGGETALDKVLVKAIGAGLPKPGRFSEGKSGGQAVRIHFAGERQFMATGIGFAPDAALGRAGRWTEQSDGWIAMRISGEKTRSVMERLTGIDLDASVFPQGAAARAPVEGMGALIACEDAAVPVFIVLFQRSSARSFAGHFRHAADSACGGR